MRLDHSVCTAGEVKTSNFRKRRLLSSAARMRATLQLTDFPGDLGGGVTPVPIPNTAVKPSIANGTARATWWESRTLPGFFLLLSF